ncbi:MAG TPA: hypothetical protein VKM72_00855 [Thermoanaerobaculia bacterium]|nr:hypothetical protein [Thermoanaerobaculia bacterium]
MTKLLQKALDEAAKLSEGEQDALGSLLLDKIEAERRREDQSTGMPWQEIRERYPHQWLLLEATKAHSSGGQRILESLTVLETFPDGLSAMRRYGEIHSQDPHRELYVLHTDRETVEIEEVHWAGIRTAS